MLRQSATVGVIVVAAGSGQRLGADVPKAFVPLVGVPLLEYAVRGALACPDLAHLVVVAPAAWQDHAWGIADAVCRSAGASVSVTVVPGGGERGESVAAGMAALHDDVDVVLVHDAARCLTPPEVFDRVVSAVLDGAPAVVPGLVVVDTIKQVDETGRVVGTPDRAALRAVQTPQGFTREVLEQAHADSSDATDDAGLVERLGLPVLVVEGDSRSLKVTTPADLEAAARILAG